MHTIITNVKDKVLDNVLYLLKNLSDIEILEDTVQLKDVELDNFGKIAIVLSKKDYDNEDYFKLK
ncbi:MAG: hypothetical protein KAI79_05235 [Bacteroidales bacterium]|nr:hypothetical protein [Bacteroidales bacterium]